MTVVNHEKCDECGTCVSVCPADAIFLGARLEISADKCASCNICVAVCPFGALSSGGEG
jgi:ferredoxin